MAHQRNNENLRKEEVLQAFVNERNKVQDNPPQTNNPNLNNQKEPAPVPRTPRTPRTTPGTYTRLHQT